MEKPFGRDLASAVALNDTLHAAFDEDQIYRIDHYMGKETVQNVLALRFANAIFEPMWNRRYIDSIQITVAEELGVEHRGSFYETAGALRDIVQNHVMQVLALTLMEPPAKIDAQSIRDEKVKLLQAVVIPSVDEAVGAAVRAQYTAGTVNGQPVVGYREEAGRRPPQPDRDLRGHEAGRRQLALGRGAHLHPHRQAAAQAGHRGDAAVPAASPTWPSAGRSPATCSPTASSCASNPTTGSACASGPRCRARPSGSGRWGWSSPTPRPSRARRPTATSACCTTP